LPVFLLYLCLSVGRLVTYGKVLFHSISRPFFLGFICGNMHTCTANNKQVHSLYRVIYDARSLDETFSVVLKGSIKKWWRYRLYICVYKKKEKNRKKKTMFTLSISSSSFDALSRSLSLCLSIYRWSFAAITIFVVSTVLMVRCTHI